MIKHEEIKCELGTPGVIMINTREKVSMYLYDGNVTFNGKVKHGYIYIDFECKAKDLMEEVGKESNLSKFLDNLVNNGKLTISNIKCSMRKRYDPFSKVIAIYDMPEDFSLHLKEEVELKIKEE